jgi:hypothetical protein
MQEPGWDSGLPLWQAYLKGLYHHKGWLTGALAFVIATVVASLINGAPWVIFLIVAAIGLSGAQFSAWRDMRAERNAARKPNDDDALPAEVEVLRREPFDYGNEVLFRLLVVNRGDRRATFFCQVVELEGGTISGPEVPFEVAWRGSGPEPLGYISLSKRGEQMIDLAVAPKVNGVTVRGQGDLQRWYPVWHLRTNAPNHGAEYRHPVPQEGVVVPDDLLTHDLRLTVRIVHEESQEIVGEKVVRLYYVEDADGIWVPQMDDPEDASSP